MSAGQQITDVPTYARPTLEDLLAGKPKFQETGEPPCRACGSSLRISNAIVHQDGCTGDGKAGS
jgi:hypothetical protein